MCVRGKGGRYLRVRVGVRGNSRCEGTKASVRGVRVDVRG